MAEGRSRHDWEHTACVLACILNASFHRDTKAQPAMPADLDPWTARDREEADAVACDHPDNFLPIECLIEAWVRNPPGRGD